MNTTDQIVRSPLSPLLRLAPTVAAISAALAAGAAVFAVSTGPGAEYAMIFPPAWLGLAGAVLLGIALLLRSTSPRRLSLTITWTASAVLLGASGGVLLDGFRAFFAVTGIPAGDFAEVDVPGAIARTTALAASFGAVQLALRITSDAGLSEQAPSRRSRVSMRLLGLLFCLPYPLLKLVWWVRGEDDSFGVGFPLMEIVAFAAAAIVLIGLTSARTPAAVRVPLTFAGWVGAYALLNMGALMVFGLLAQLTGLAAAPLEFGDPTRAMVVLAVYATWSMLGAMLAAATVLYGRARPARRA